MRFTSLATLMFVAAGGLAVSGGCVHEHDDAPVREKETVIVPEREQKTVVVQPAPSDKPTIKNEVNVER